MVTSDHRIKVVDFGIARRLDAAGVEQATITGSPTSRLVAGTPAYMSPEVLRGEAADVRSDVWALGVLLYEMAPGRRPFRGLDGVRGRGVASWRDRRARSQRACLPGIRTIVQRCLAVDLAERFQRVADVVLHSRTFARAVGGAPSDESPRTARRLRDNRRAHASRCSPCVAATACWPWRLQAWWRPSAASGAARARPGRGSSPAGHSALRRGRHR